MASLLTGESKNAHSSPEQLDRATRTELAAWRFLKVSTNDDSAMPASLFLSKEQEQEINAKHEKTVASDVARTKLRTNSSKEGETKATTESDAAGGGDEPQGQVYDCVICYDEIVYTDDSGIWQNGILCHGTSAGAPHFICTDCFRQHVEYDACRPGGRFETELEVQGGVSQPGEFPCPSAANPNGCDCSAFDVRDIYRALGHHQTSFDAFNA